MEFNNTDAANAGSPGAASASPLPGEIDLYEELKAFAELSPEEQKRLVELPESATEEATVQVFPPQPIVTQLPMPEELDAGASPGAIESVPVDQDSSEHVETRRRPFEIINPSGFLIAVNPSGPLSAMNPPLLFTGALSKGVCLACGAESGIDDLFCITCGAFIDEVASSQPPNPSCLDCSMQIVAGEIFCPGCGSVLPA